MCDIGRATRTVVATARLLKPFQVDALRQRSRQRDCAFGADAGSVKAAELEGKTAQPHAPSQPRQRVTVTHTAHSRVGTLTRPFAGPCIVAAQPLQAAHPRRPGRRNQYCRRHRRPRAVSESVPSLCVAMSCSIADVLERSPAIHKPRKDVLHGVNAVLRHASDVRVPPRAGAQFKKLQLHRARRVPLQPRPVSGDTARRRRSSARRRRGQESEDRRAPFSKSRNVLLVAPPLVARLRVAATPLKFLLLLLLLLLLELFTALKPSSSSSLPFSSSL